MENSKSRTRYNSIKERSFKSYLDLFLIRCYLDDKTLSNATFDAFILFDLNDSKIFDCYQAYQKWKNTDLFDMKPVSELDNVVEIWLSSNDVKEYKAFYIDHRLISTLEFKHFYMHDDYDRECEYCGIKESEIKILIEKKDIKTKRLSTRGRFMEVDKRDPRQGYVIDNIVLSCYWCNNAKTDEFTDEEFQPIADEIGNVFRNRLKNN